MRTRLLKVEVGNSGWTRESPPSALPPRCPVGMRCKVYQLRPETSELYVLDGNRNGYTIPHDCFEPEREIQLPFPQKGWAHESDPKAQAALREDVENSRRLAQQRPDLYPHFQESLIARNEH